MTRIRTLEFLPSIFQTETNSQFLSATLDQLVNPPVTKTIQGFVGSKVGYGINAKDYYVTEPNKVRRDYQLEPGVVFLKNNESVANDFISYPGILDSLKLQGAITDKNNKLFESQFYSWDSFTNLDKIINYNQYYWLPEGPPAVVVAASTVFTENDYIVTELPEAYNIRAIGAGAGTNNPTITLLRGGTYTFTAPRGFWIQGEPGVTGYSVTQPNLYVRDIYGVDGNGSLNGVVRFQVPQKDAQDDQNFPGNNPIGVISRRPFSEINGARLSAIGGIDGITALNGRTVMFYDTGAPNEIGYVSAFFDQVSYDVNSGSITSPISINASSINSSGLLTVSDVSQLIIGQTITFVGTSFGGIQAYSANPHDAIPTSNLIPGQKYFISQLGSTNWINAGVMPNAVIDAELVGAQLKVYKTVSGSFSIGDTITGSGIATNTKIVDFDEIATNNNYLNASTVTIGDSYLVRSFVDGNGATTDFTAMGAPSAGIINGSIVGTILTVNSITSGTVDVGSYITGPGIANGTYIVSEGTVENTYVLNKTQVVSGPMTLQPNVGTLFTATAVGSGSGTVSIPTYTVNNSQTVARNSVDVYPIQEGTIFTAAAADGGNGFATPFDPPIYYVTGIDSGTNQITISQSLNGPTFLPAASASGSMTVRINQGLYEQGFYTQVNDTFYTIVFLGDIDDPVLSLRPAGSIPINQKITPQYGTQYVGLHFVKNSAGVIQEIPYISAPLDTLYYQNDSNPNRVGVIKLIENNETNLIDVDTDILGKQTYTSKNGVTFTNGLKVTFDGDVIPRSYLEGEYYVEGVGSAIELIPVTSLEVPEPFTASTFSPYDILPYDIGPFDEGLNIPINPDYITIARNAINKNAWSRSNRWFHIQVIQASADYNDNAEILDEYAIPSNKAKRPILEFYPNLKLFNSGTIGKSAVDFVDTRTTNAFEFVENQQNYYPDVQTYTAYQGTVNENDTPITVANLLIDQYYVIETLGTTSDTTWQELGVAQDQDGGFEIGVEYIITNLGTTTQANWNLIAGTDGETYARGNKFIAKQTGTGTGDGTAFKVLFQATSGGVLSSNELTSGQVYTISSLGTTQWNNIGYIGTPIVGGVFTATGPAIGTGTAIQGDGTVKQKTTTTVTIDPDHVTGTFSQGQWINDLRLNEASALPTGTRILSIQNTDPYQMTVYWPIPSDNITTPATGASFVASTKDNTDLLLFPGARVVFAADENLLVRNKIYVVGFNNTGSESYPVITLTEAEDGNVLENDMFSVEQGFYNRGKTFYFNGEDYKQAQQKQTVNQAPLFDIFDENGISYGDPAVYNSSSFNGCKLFNYKISEGVNDTILGFPISFSSINNVGDISFEVSLYTQTFDYIDNGNSVTSYVNNGFVYDYNTRDEYDRLTGWQTAVAPSTQYQVFQFEYIANDPALALAPDETFDYVVTVNVPQLSVDETIWPSLEVYNNNNILTLDTDYTVENKTDSTVITIKLSKDVDTPIQVLILSDKVSKDAYYTIPINLSNNPFNSNPDTVDIGDIRGHYQTIFDNNPNTDGIMFGSNNYRDLGNMVPWGNRIIQNSASLVLPGAFLRNPRHNLFDALLFNSREYVKFKTLLVDTTNNLDIQQKYDPSLVLDLALDVITSVKSQDQSFFWSDMIPNKAPYISQTYTFNNQAETSVFPLSKIYDFSTANYDGVLVYLQRKIQGVTVTKQLLRGRDYTVSTDSPSVTVKIFLEINDKIIVKEYNQTYGSYIPNTPTKLGLYPLYVPTVVLDDTYTEPTYFIQGHDGSYNKLYGEYDQNLGMLVDFRDQVLLEFETRVYNNIKLSRTLPIDTAEIVPGYFRDTALSYVEFTEIYSKNFLDWIGQNRLNYKAQIYNANDPYSYNYRDSSLKLDNSKVLQGYWRGIYEYLYDTSTPNLTPWAMIGYANKPDWWETRYGAAPYTSNNLILWTDLQDGIDYNNGDPVVRPLYQRPGLLNIIPVDGQGNLREPLDAVISNYNQLTFKRDWRVGDDAPVEYSYRKSSTYPFDLMRLEALLKPANFFNLGSDLDNYKYNAEFDQFLVNGRSHLVPANIEIYGNGTAKTSYINWIVDYEKQLGVDATKNIKELLTNLDVRLVYRLAGFSDKTLLKFFVEKGTPESRNSSLLIPDESYQILLYQNQPMTKLIYSGVVVQKVQDGYAIFGNSQTTAFFKILKPILNGPKKRITVQDASVNVADNYSNEEEIIPYGTIYYTLQDVSQFLMSYGAWLTANGAVFDDQIQNVAITWNQMVAEFLYWTQTGFITGSIITLNPAARKLTIDKESQVVQPLTYDNSNFVLNNNLYPIQNKDLSIFRDGTVFSITPLNEGDAVSYGQFNLSNIEHAVVFQNETLFNDTIYNLKSGLKQNRIYVRGTKSGEWNGTLFASGFIYNQDNIVEWVPGSKYTKGAIVKYKNKFFTALKIVQPNQKFKEDEWKETDYDEIQKGLLPNSSTRSYESALYYDANKANLEQDADLLSFSLIGFRPREYMASADLTDITQVNVYKNLIREKGTLNALKAFKGANLPQGGIDYDVYENWAILQGTFGGTLNDNFVQFKLQENNLSNNPSIVGITDGNDVEGAQQLVPLYSFFNYGRPVTDPNILPKVTSDIPSTEFPTAGYVNINDVRMSAYFYSNLPTAVDKNGLVVPLSDLDVGDYVWLADYKASWQILTPSTAGRVLLVRNNLNGTSTVRFAQDHNLNRYDIFAIINFDGAVNGYYVANNIVSPREVLITLALPPSVRAVTGEGVAMKFASQRVVKPGNIQNLPLLNNEFTKNTVWVDENNDGGWAVYRKNINFQYEREFTKANSQKFGAAVAYTPLTDYLFSDPDLGKVYRYQFDGTTDNYDLDEILSGNTTFGSTIVHEQNIVAISQPENTPKVSLYTVNDTRVTDNIILYQEILASTIDPAITNFGKALALSGDTNWLFISDYDEDILSARNKVHVLRKRNEIIDVDNTTVLDADATYQILDAGTVDWVDIALEPIANETGIYFKWNGVTTPTGAGTAIRCDYQYVATINSDTTIDKFGYSLATNNDGTILVVGAPSKDLDVVNQGRAYVYNRLIQNYEVPVEYISGTPITFTLAWAPAVGLPLTVSRNGRVVEDTEYSFVGTNFTFDGVYAIGDIITVSGNEFVHIQEMNVSDNSRIGPQFGHAVDTNTFGTEILIGAPFYISSKNSEGSVDRYTNGSARFGTITSTSDVNVTTTRQLLINGYLVDIPAGNANLVASAINNAKITNILATTVGAKLSISLVNNNIALSNQELLISVTDIDTLSELGFEIYTRTQTILNPHLTGPSQFGTVIKFNEQNSVAISAPSGTRYALTTFDFIDDENYQNDTIFDNNATQFLDSFANAGAVYVYDYLGNYNESLLNIGNYTYAQSVNDNSLVYGSQPRYGTALDWSNDRIIVGSPDYRPEDVDGQVVIYDNTLGTTNWVVLRQTSPVVDINKVYNVQLFSAETNNTLSNLDYMDPLQGKLLGAIRQNIDVISNIDPASYNNSPTTASIVWGESQLGTIWFDTSNIRYINYHQNDNSYNARYWGTFFPGSDVAVYSWVGSTVQPSAYTGPGIPKDIASYTVQTVLNSSNTIVPIYYFWVRNTGIVYRNKTLSDTNIAQYLNNPKSSGISYIAPIRPDAVALYNVKQFLNANDTVLQLGYSTGSQDNPAHQQFTLIRQDFPDDFLPGVPDTRGYITPESLYDRLLDSMSGVDETGAVVPDPFLPKAVQSGVLARPRQSFFYNRYKAIQNYLQYANTIMALYPISEIRSFNFLNTSGRYYDTTDYWENINWWAPGYDNNTKAVLQVQVYADLSALEVANGTIVTVAQNSNGSAETYRYDGAGVWYRIGLQNGTIRFKDELYDYSAAGFGFGGTFYDTDSFDIFPSEETRWIIRALNEQIYTNELLIYRNKSLILLFEYIQEETVENQNYLPWLNKTSLIDVSHKIRELKPLQNFVSDNEQFLEGYVNETKPYHVVIKEFSFDYTGTDVYPGTLTDFDLPATYDNNINKFVSPELVYSNPNTDYEFLPDSQVWTNEKYTEWFNNYGVSLTGQENYEIAKLESYLTLASQNIIVDNPQGFPVNGIIMIGEEKISYASVDRGTGLISGLTRGIDQTPVTDHLPGEQIRIDLPGVLVLDTGRNYANPPRVLATIDTTIYPEPKQEAVLEAVMSLGSVVAINVVDPGQGYAVTPEIVIDPAEIFSFDSGNVSVTNNTIDIYAPILSTGDLVRYAQGTENIGGLADKQYYYINVLSSNPTTTMALYTTYADAINDNNRVNFLSQGAGTQKFEFGARAVPITSSTPVRENNITLRFDRTTYNTQVTDWAPNTFYGSEFVSYTLESASSEISLASVQPDINTILSSAQGTVFPLVNVNNDRQVIWSSFERKINYIVSNNEIELVYTTSAGDENPSGSTIGFTIGMPVKFTGITGPEIEEGRTYYISEIVDLRKFKISETEGGSTLPLAPNSYLDMKMFTAQVIDTAEITTMYSGYRNVTATTQSNNAVKVELSAIGTAGTNGFYTNLPVYFTGTTFGGLEADKIYYVVSLLGAEAFTLSETPDPVTVRVLEMNAASQIIVQNTNGLKVNDPIVFDSMTIGGEGVDAFGNIQKQTIYYIKSIGINVITISTTLGGATFNTGVVAPANDNYCFITSQANVKQLTNATGSCTMVVSLPVSPGQVNGQKFTFYPTSQHYADITAPNLTYGNLVQKNIEQTLPDNEVAFLSNRTGLYTGFPFTVSTTVGADLVNNIGGLEADKTYYAYDIGNVEVECQSTSSSTLIYNATFSGTTMDVTSIISGSGVLYPGTLVTGTGVQPNTYIKSYIGGTGGVGTYEVSREYFVPVVTTDATSVTGVILLSPDYDTNMIYEGMPIVFSLLPLGGVVLGFTYYVRHIISSSRFTITQVKDEASITLSVSNGAMLGTGSPTLKAYSPLGELTIGYKYIINKVGDGAPTSAWTDIGATFINDVTTLTPGDVIIIYTKGTTDWNYIAGTTGLTYNVNDIITVENSGLFTVGAGTAFIAEFIATGAGVTGYDSRATVVLAASSDTATLNQEITSDPTFDVGYILGGYKVIVNNGGAGFTQNNTITIPGNVLGGTTPNNDLTLTVSRINAVEPGAFSWSLPKESDGIITKVIESGTPIGAATNYFLKVTGANTFKVYSDPLMQLPVSGIDFPYEGYTQANIVNVNYVDPFPGTPYTDIELSDASEFSINQTITFTELDNASYTISEGSTYYIVYKLGNTIRVSNDPGNDPIAISNVSITTTNALVTSAGSLMLLPEPFYFNPSIVKYNNRVWVCTVSNNDDEFVFGKWEELNSGDRRLNALDRAKGYYAPDVNMPGTDLTQLFTGLTYPNTTYKGNDFDPGQQYPLDTRLVDTPFDPKYVNVPAVEWDGQNYIAPANLPNYAAVIADIEVQDDWLLSTLANQPLSLTDITRVDDLYLMTSANAPTPLFKSVDKVRWSTNGFVVPIGTNPASADFFKIRLISSGISLNAVTHHNGTYVAVGSSILVSTDATLWFETYTYPFRELFDVSYIETTAFTGYIAVGVEPVNKPLILRSTDGQFWTKVTGLNDSILKGVTHGFNTIYAVGTNGRLLTSPDGQIWQQVSLPGSPSDFNAVTYADNTVVIVGNNGRVYVSTDGVNFVQKITETPANLNDAIYVAERGQWTIVGDNNTIIQTQNIAANPVTWDKTQVFSSPAPDYTVQGDPFLSGYGPEEMVPGIVTDQLTMIINTRAGTTWPATEYAHVGYNVVSTEYEIDISTNKYSFDNIVQDPAYVNVFLINNDGTSRTLYQGLNSPYLTYTVDWINKTVSLGNYTFTAGDMLRIDVYEVGNGDQLVKSSTYDDPIELNAVTGFSEIALDCNYNNVGYSSGGIVLPNTSGALYTEPAVFCNGNLLNSGLTNYVLSTQASTHYITTYSTEGLQVDQPIVFSDTIFGGITPKTTYYVRGIINATQFTIKDEMGDPIYLTTASGSAIFVTNDFAVGIAENQINAKVIFANNYDKETDYLSYSFFGPTEPIQYGFTIPLTQTVKGEGVTGPYQLNNNSLTGDNVENAIVEIDGLRINPGEYSFDIGNHNISFATLTPSANSYVGVTTFNDTERQYLFTTQYDTSNKQVTPISIVNNNITLTEPTVRITTTIPHNLETDDLVRIDGCVGAQQLNNHPVFIIEKVDDYTVKLFDYVEGIPLSASGPVNIVDAYVGGGYIWKAYSWILENKRTTASVDNKLVVASVRGLVAGTPVYFTEDGKQPGDNLTLSQLVYGQEYYIKEINEFTDEFNISATRDGDELVLSNMSGFDIAITQWEQDNVDRLWVTVNGRRVASSNLRLNPANEVSILTEVLPGDDVVITSMMPSATPDSNTYLQMVDAQGQGTVYRANSDTKTWLEESVGEFTTTIKVGDVSRVTNVVTQTNTTPALDLGVYRFVLLANRIDIAEVRVYNNNPSRLGYINQSYLNIVVSGVGAELEIQPGIWIQPGDILTITTLEGKTIYINGEYMTILSVDQAKNLIEVKRGALGSMVNVYIPNYSTVYGLLEQNRMSQINYDITWNKIPGIYNPTMGDPLQIADSSEARFLRTDIT